MNTIAPEEFTSAPYIVSGVAVEDSERLKIVIRVEVDAETASTADMTLKVAER